MKVGKYYCTFDFKSGSRNGALYIWTPAQKIFMKTYMSTSLMSVLVDICFDLKFPGRSSDIERPIKAFARVLQFPAFSHSRYSNWSTMSQASTGPYRTLPSKS